MSASARRGEPLPPPGTRLRASGEPETCTGLKYGLLQRWFLPRRSPRSRRPSRSGSPSCTSCAWRLGEFPGALGARGRRRRGGRGAPLASRRCHGEPDPLVRAVTPGARARSAPAAERREQRGRGVRELRVLGPACAGCAPGPLLSAPPPGPGSASLEPEVLPRT